MRWLLFSVLYLAALAGRSQSAPALPPDTARIEVRYNLTYRPDSTDPATRTEVLRLRLGSRLSRCENIAKVYMDSVMAAAITAAEATQSGDDKVLNIDLSHISASKFHARFEEVIYKIPTAGTEAVYDGIGMGNYEYQEPTGLFSWTLTPTTATVAGYACQRATTAFGGRQWEAWFTREVPVGDGPYKFYGLPGLIVKVGDARQHYLFELTQLRQLVPPVVIAPPEASAKLITKAEFRRGKTEYERNGLAQLMASGNIRYGSSEAEAAAQQKMRKRAKRKANPLELR